MLPKKPKGTTAQRRAAKKRLADKVYAANRLKVIKRDVACRWCHWRGSEVHHIKPRSLGVDHSTGNLILLCLLCHAKIHGKFLRVSGDADTMLTFEVLK